MLRNYLQAQETDDMMARQVFRQFVALVECIETDRATAVVLDARLVAVVKGRHVEIKLPRDSIHRNIDR